MIFRIYISRQKKRRRIKDRNSQTFFFYYQGRLVRRGRRRRLFLADGGKDHLGGKDAVELELLHIVLRPHQLGPAAAPAAAARSRRRRPRLPRRAGPDRAESATAARPQGARRGQGEGTKGQQEDVVRMAEPDNAHELLLGHVHRRVCAAHIDPCV